MASSNASTTSTRFLMPVTSSAAINHTANLNEVFVSPEFSRPAAAAPAVVLIVSNSVVMMLSVAGNATVLYVIGRHLRCRTATNVYIAVLSCSDMTSALVCLPISFALFLRLVTSFPLSVTAANDLCIAGDFVNRTFGLLSTAMLSLLMADRYCSIVLQRPRSAFIARRTFAVVAAIVSGAAILSTTWYTGLAVSLDQGHVVLASGEKELCLFVGGWSVYEPIFWICTSGVAAIMMTYCSCRLLRVVARSSNTVRPSTTSVNQLLFHDELQTAITVVVMATVYVICRIIGLAFVCQLSMAMLSANQRSVASDQYGGYLATLAVWLNGSINPIIYAVRNPNVSRILNMDLGVWTRRRRRGYVADSSGVAPPYPQPAPTDSPADIPQTKTELSATALPVPSDDIITYSSTAVSGSSGDDVEFSCSDDRKWVQGVSRDDNVSVVSDLDEVMTVERNTGRPRFDSLFSAEVDFSFRRTDSAVADTGGRWAMTSRRSSSIPNATLTMSAMTRQRKSSDTSGRTTSTTVSFGFPV